MHSKISRAACSRVSNVRACTHSALMGPMSDSIAALSHGDDAEPFDWVSWYNSCRLHSTLGYMTPVGFREAGLILS